MKKVFVYNNKSMKNRRRMLRNNPTEAEKLFWKMIRKSQLGFKFVRQYSIEGYVLDFYCAEKRLAIELDGGIHMNKIEYDTYRNNWLKSADIKVIHVKNEDVWENINMVMNKLFLELKSPS